MSTATERFPKAAFARQINGIVDELWNWSAKYKTDALPENLARVPFAQQDRVEIRARKLEELAHDLGDIAFELEALP